MLCTLESILWRGFILHRLVRKNLVSSFLKKSLMFLSSNNETFENILEMSSLLELLLPELMHEVINNTQESVFALRLVILTVLYLAKSEDLKKTFPTYFRHPKLCELVWTISFCSIGKDSREARKRMSSKNCILRKSVMKSSGYEIYYFWPYFTLCKSLHVDVLECDIFPPDCSWEYVTAFEPTNPHTLTI